MSRAIVTERTVWDCLDTPGSHAGRDKRTRVTVGAATLANVLTAAEGMAAYLSDRAATDAEWAIVEQLEADVEAITRALAKAER